MFVGRSDEEALVPMRLREAPHPDLGGANIEVFLW